MSKRVLGLDIGTHAVKFVEMEHSSKGSVITNCGYVRISENNLEYDLSNALKHYLSKQKVQAKKVVISIPACSTDNITLQLNFEENIAPNISNKELRDLVWLRTTDPESDPYDTIIDCQLLKSTTGSGAAQSRQRSGAEYLFASVKREYIEERIELIQKAGLIPVAIDVDLFALERLAEYTGQLPSDSYATIIDIGNSKASIGFYKNGILNFLLDVDQGGRDITKDIADNLDMELNQAEAYKLKETLFQKVGDSDLSAKAQAGETVTSGEDEQGSFSSLLEVDSSDNQVDATMQAETTPYDDEDYSNLLLAGEDMAGAGWRTNPEIANMFGAGRHGLYQSLSNCFSAYEADYSEAQLSKIILAGGTSQMNNIEDFFAAKLEVPTEIINYTDTIPIQPQANRRRVSSENSKNLDMLKENEPTYAVAVGLALKLAPSVKNRTKLTKKERSTEAGSGVALSRQKSAGFIGGEEE